MANTTTSTYMSLPVPIPGVDPGPQYAIDLNSCLALIDQHDHSSGNGVQIKPAGININSDLAFNSNNAVTLRTVRFSSQGAALSGAADLGCLYEVGADLYYNDGSGNQVRITQSGGIAGSPGSISNLTSPATASYVAATSTFVWQSAANTPANLDAGSVLFRNIAANSKALTLSPPNAMGSNYALTLPSLPAAQAFLTLDTSGNISGSVPLSLGITGSMMAASTITGAKIASATVTGSNIASATIAGSNIASSTITNSNIAASTITGAKIASGINLAGFATVNGTNDGITVSSLTNGSSSNTRLSYGWVNSAGGIVGGTGFNAVSRATTGVYLIQLNTALSSGPFMVATPMNGSTATWCNVSQNGNTFNLVVRVFDATNTLVDGDFMFFAAGPT